MGDIEAILRFWFGQVEKTIIPSENRSRLWFGDNNEADQAIRNDFSDTLEKAIRGDYAEWEASPRGQLALIIVLDQFSRRIYRDTPKAYHQDDYALKICRQGIAQQTDHSLSLIERVFYFFPLIHSEYIANQEQALGCYRGLIELALPETEIIYDSFFKFANHHYTIVERFDRFPQRNSVLKRVSTKEEIQYLQNAGLL